MNTASLVFNGIADIRRFVFLASRDVVAHPPEGLLIGSEDPYAKPEGAYAVNHGFRFRIDGREREKAIITGIRRKNLRTMTTEPIDPDDDNPQLRSAFQATMKAIGQQVAAEISSFL